MTERMPNILFSLTLACAVAIAGTVVAAPYVIGDGRGVSDVLLLFARDMTVRRTAFFCSVGLLATAFIFFRSTAAKKKRKDQPVNMTGA